jgi:hypothetical protein
MRRMDAKRRASSALARVLTVVGVAAAAALVLAAAGCRSGKAGSHCNPSGSAPCDEGLLCAADTAGDDVCQVPLGGACDPGADESFCVAPGECFAQGDSGVCGLGEGAACDPATADAQCGPGLSCAEVTGGADPYECFPPVLVEGRVFDAVTDTGIEGAQVIALDDLGSAITDVAVSAADGTYTLEVPAARDMDGAPLPLTFTLRASAADYQTFPGGLRTALPLYTTDAVSMDAGWIIATPPTDIALVPLPAGETGNPSISGTVTSMTRVAGVLVVAESTAGAGYSAVSAADGSYTIFNVPDGDYTVRGYAAGLQLVPVDVTVAGADLTGVDLADSTDPLGSISGTIQIVNPGTGTATSVVLVVASTFDDTFVRGEVPPGLRAPLTGAPSITGAFTIDGVPAGDYVVLAAFENDDLVRDPDPNIAGTQIVTVTMPDPVAGTTVTLATSFKVTGALEVIGPGADGPEGVTDPPTFSWVDDASEDYYSIVVYDSYGNLAWEDPMVPSSAGADVMVTYGGPPLEAGLYYQFRATSWRTPGGMPGPISTTEDLRGVFFLQ